MLVMARVIGASIFVLALAGAAGAAPTPEESCLKARQFAAAAYASCHHKALGRLYLGAFDADLSKFHGSVSKCSIKYQATWPLLQTRYPGTSCAPPRFVDNGDSLRWWSRRLSGCPGRRTRDRRDLARLTASTSSFREEAF